MVRSGFAPADASIVGMKTWRAAAWIAALTAALALQALAAIPASAAVGVSGSMNFFPGGQSLELSVSYDLDRSLTLRGGAGYSSSSDSSRTHVNADVLYRLHLSGVSLDFNLEPYVGGGGTYVRWSPSGDSHLQPYALAGARSSADGGRYYSFAEIRLRFGQPADYSAGVGFRL